MATVVISFFASLLLCLLIVKFSGRHKKLLDHDLTGVQKNHSHPVPRIGGAGIFSAAVIAICFVYGNAPEVGLFLVKLLFSSIAAFACGIVEDYSKSVSPLRRLIFTMIAATIGYFFLGAAILRMDMPFIDIGLSLIWISLPLTIFAVAGIANAINIIDGFNGLASSVTIFMLLSLAYVAFQVGDVFVQTAAFIMIGAIAGFLVWNYPYGLIFLGDGGAYFIGFMLGELAVLLVARNPQVSPWYPALLLIYPVFETIFSIYRRKYIRGVSPGLPDGIHLHVLVFKRLVRWTIGRRDAKALLRRNSLTSPYLWLLSLLAVIPATLFWTNTWLLVLCCLLFMMGYIWLYLKIIRFDAPIWMILRKKNRKNW